MAVHRNVPSADDTRRVVKELEDVTDELRVLHDRLSELTKNESQPTLRCRPRNPADNGSGDHQR